MTADLARASMTDAFGATPAVTPDGLALTIEPERWLLAAEHARHTLGCGFFAFLTAVDLKDDGLDVVARVENLDVPFALTLRTRLVPGRHTCPSLVPVYRGADWMERECFDMFGITFEGHPDLRRILLPDDWVGHPLLKSYAVDTPYPPYR